MLRPLPGALLVTVLAAPLAATPGPDDPVPGRLPVWAIWWARNRPVLIPPAGPGAGWTRGAAGARADRLPIALRPAGAARRLLRIGLSADPSGLFELLGAVRSRDRAGQAAVLALGLYGRRASVGHLEALLRDRPSGRHLCGAVSHPVPAGHRTAAALALGLSGRPAAYQALRGALRTELDDDLGASVLVALSFSGMPSDALRFERVLRSSGGAPLMREAAAAALGRHAVHVPGARRLLRRLLSSDPARAGRGAAVGLWFDGPGEAEAEGEALRSAALRSPDATVRLLALVALAGRGDRRALDLIERGLAGAEPHRSQAVLASGLLGRARPGDRDRTLRMIARAAGTAPEAARAARALLEGDAGRARPRRGRSLANVAGGNALFVGAPHLSALLDLAAGIER